MNVAEKMRTTITKMEQWQKRLEKGEGVARVAEQIKKEVFELKRYLSNTEQ